jgi:dTDP-glucose pyrophosphorylase
MKAPGKNLRALAVKQNATIREAMQAISRGGVQIALMVDDHWKLLGTITDGDLRVGLLDGKDLNDAVLPLVNREFTAARARMGRAEILDLMNARAINQIPIVDERGILIGLQHMHELIGAENKPNMAVIMAGGRGSRLRPVTDSVPKPMLKVAGRPILERLVLHLAGHGIREIYIAVNYLAEMIEEHFGDGTRFGCEIKLLREEKALGTGGALSLLPDHPSHPLLVLNGDLITQVNITDMLAFHHNGGCQITLAVRDYLYTVPFGVVGLEDQKVVSFSEKPSRAWTINAGIYVLEPELLKRIPAEENFPITTLLESCLSKKEKVGAFHLHGDWIDVGRAADLQKARGDF